MMHSALDLYFELYEFNFEHYQDVLQAIALHLVLVVRSLIQLIYPCIYIHIVFLSFVQSYCVLTKIHCSLVIIMYVSYMIIVLILTSCFESISFKLVVFNCC